VLLVPALVLVSLAFTTSPAFAAKQYAPAGSFGAEGSGDGQFKEPTGVAVNDATGNVYVLDRGNDRVEEFTSTGVYLGQFNGTDAPTGAFSSPEAIAVDNSVSALDAAKEDLYVVDGGHKVIDRFTASGVYVAQLKETTAGSPLGFLHGIAVDHSGNVWVDESPEEVSVSSIDEFSDTGSFVKTFETRGFAGPEFPGLGVDSAGNLYIDTCCQGRVEKYDSDTGTNVARFAEGQEELEGVVAVAVNPETDNVLLDRGPAVLLYGPFGEPYSAPLESFPSEGLLSESHGIAASGAGDRAYASQRTADDIVVFDYVSFPDVAAPFEVGPTEATMHGSIDPENEAVTECRFEYGTESSSEHSEPCEQTPTGASRVPVSAKLHGLEPRTTYHFRLSVVVEGQTRSSDELTFYTVDKPAIQVEPVSNISSTEATLSAHINPSSLPSSYQVEYGTNEAYGSKTPETSLPASQTAVSVQVHLSGLEANTVYHFRFVASNALGLTNGSDVTFTTAIRQGLEGGLPDSRVYEMVSPLANADGEVYYPFNGQEADTNEGTTNRQLGTSLPFRASADGNAVAYAAEAGESGGNGLNDGGQGNEWLGTRTTRGWSSVDIQPPGLESPVSVGFSTDLAVGFVRSSQPLTSDAPAGCTEGGNEVLYSRTTTDGLFRAAFTTSQTPGECGVPVFAGVSADDAHALFESPAALTSGAVPGSKTKFQATYNLYESVAGRLYQVNVLPSGVADVNASFGTVSNETEEEEPGVLQPGYRHFAQVISADGARVFWTDLNTAATAENPGGGTRLFVREGAAGPNPRTVQIDAAVGNGGQYQAASSDGSTVMFTRAGHLYAFDVTTGQTTDLAPEGQVLGVAGTSEDGSYVYFVSQAVLGEGKNPEGNEAAAGADNLYVRNSAHTRFIAALTPEDDTSTGLDIAGFGRRRYGVWRGGLQTRTAEVTPDGKSLVFTSNASLTGYNNIQAQEQECHIFNGSDACAEVFVYSYSSGRLSCASCDPSGARPHFQAYLPGNGGGEPNRYRNTYQPRWITDDGSRVFFGTAESLLPQDTNGAQDVYEWERDGAGTCRQDAGCVYLISSGGNQEDSWFVDASASGDDVFFTTRAQLVKQDRNEGLDLYDARVGGGFPEVTTACTGTGCQGVPPAPESFATPASLTFAGAGNFPPALVIPPEPKPKVTCAKGKKLRRGKCIKTTHKRHKQRTRRASHHRRGK
jgi:hypothetical protein